MTGNKVRNGIGVGGVVLLVVGVAVYRESGGPPASSQAAAVPRLVDLGSDKCIPCKEMAPILAELKQTYAGKASIEFIDVRKDEKSADAYDVRIIPTQVFFDRTGREVWRHEGFLSRVEIVAKLKELGAG